MKPLRERIGLNCCMKSSAGDDQWEQRSEFLRILSPFPHQLEFISFTAKLPDGDGCLSVIVVRLISLKQPSKAFNVKIPIRF